MSTPIVIKYPYDPTGLAVTNLVSQELHVIPVTRNRAFALNAGPFYAKSVVVTSMPNNVPLTRGVDYEILYLYQEATRITGQEVCAVIYVTNPAISGQLLVDYQVVGGEFSSNVSAIQQLIQSLLIDNRSVVWDDIIDKPVTFPPAPHLHDVGDLYGMEALVDAINDLKNAILNSDETAIAILTEQVNTLQQQVAQLLTATQQQNANMLALTNRVAALEA